MFFSYKDAATFIPVTITGVVHDTRSGKPLANARVSIVKDGNVSVTSANGEFSIQTWQPLPLIVLIQGEAGQTQRLKVVTGQKKYKICLGANAMG